MIMIRPSAAQKMGKPPPPVPPRPSKSVVAEALAKSRHNNKLDAQGVAKTKSPIRQAPPPPAPEIIKSKSSYSVNVMLKKPPVFERSISEETKNAPRPVVYQSANVKYNNNNKVQITRKDSDVKIVNRVESFRNEDGVQVVRKDSVKKSDDARNRVQISRKNSDKRDSLITQKLVEKLAEGDRKELVENKHLLSGNVSETIKLRK